MLDIQNRAAEPRDADDLTALFNCPGVIAGTPALRHNVHDAYQAQGVGHALMPAMVDLADNWRGEAVESQ